MEIGRIGVELEGFVYRHSKHGRLVPVDVYEWICSQDGDEGRDELPVLTDVGPVIVKTDAGRHMIELALPPFETREIWKIPVVIKDVLHQLPREWIFFWQGCDSGSGLGWAPKPRYQALIEALRRECNNEPRWQGVHRMCRIASVHVHWEVDWTDPRTIKLVNRFNLPNPIFYGFASEERMKAWRDNWADKGRLPFFRSFDSLAQMWDFRRDIPRLIKRGKDGWEPDGVTVPSLGDSIHAGTVWWLARPREDLGTLEIRIPDSMPPEWIPTCIGQMLEAI